MIQRHHSPTRPRVPGLVYGGILVALVAILSFIALTARQPPPPAIAEFAPKAVEQITQTQLDQSSEFGVGVGAEGSAVGGEVAPEPETEPVEVPRIRKCIGNPPRQIEDPQSPPCVAYWKGDNGGATWKGVTANEIRIMLPTGNPDQSAQSNIFPALERFFNKRFEFYGRSLRFVPGGPYPNAGTNDVATQIATATEADEKHDVFASLRYRTAQGFYYHDELARRRIPSFTGVEFGGESRYLKGRGPYIWQYMMETDSLLRNIGEWACKRLVGGNAIHSGSSAFRMQPRAFGIIVQTYYNRDETTAEALEAELARCGTEAKVSLRNPMQAATGSEDNQTQPDSVSANNTILQMSSKNVSSVFCVCQPYASGALMKAASNQGYFPEWLLSSYGAQDTIWGIRLGALGSLPYEQLAHAFGITVGPRMVRPEMEPYIWAAREGDPTFRTSEGNSGGTITIFRFSYRNVLVLASAIQMAGPRLTPDTLAQGLQRTTFPNPDHPNKAGRVGFRPDRFAMTSDGAEWWWSNTDFSPYGNTGTICYVNRGARHTYGSWPTGEDPFFKPPCDSGA